MKKNIMVATGLLSTVIPVALTNESEAINDIKEVNENIRSIAIMNKIGRVKGVANNDTLNVRKEPNTTSSVVFTLKNSTQIKIIGQDSESGWYKVTYNNNTGYASNRYIEIIGDVYTEYEVTGDINIRKEPSWSGEKVAVAKKGDILNVISIDGDWAKISYNSSIYYVPANYLKLNETNGSVEDKPPQDSNISTIKYKVTEDINIRKEPSWSGEKVAIAKKGDILNVISIDGDWAKISYNSSIYYVPANYLKLNETNGSVEDKPPQDSNISTIKYKVTEDINIRKEPSWSGEKVAIAKKGDILNVISINGDWGKISYNSSIYYVPANYLIKLDSPDSTLPPLIEDDSDEKTLIATVNTDNLNIRAGAGMSFSILAKANKGDVVLIKNKNTTNGWYNVELSSGIIGWCYETYIEDVREGSLPSSPSEDSSVIHGRIATVNTDDLNIRSGSSTSYPILAKVNKGDIVLIKESSSNGWYKVQLENGIIGWCNGTYLENFRNGSITITPDNSGSQSIEEAINKVISVAKAQIGKPYVWGATGPDSFDCSGLTYYAYKNGADITLPRNSKSQATAGKYVAKSDLQPGDLVFFNTGGSGISHVGIYIGNNEMVHAPSSGKNVQIVKITYSYWVNSYVTARRIIY